MFGCPKKFKSTLLILLLITTIQLLYYLRYIETITTPFADKHIAKLLIFMLLSTSIIHDIECMTLCY